MANMRVVNQYIKANFPEMDIKAVRGDGYIYFDGKDGFDKVPSIYVHPVSCETEDLVQMVLEEIENYRINNL